MASYHISKSGNPGQCETTPESCPLGGSHFNTEKDAQDHINQKAQEDHPTVPAAAKKLSSKGLSAQAKDNDATAGKFSVTLSGGSEPLFVENFETEMEAINLFAALKPTLEPGELLIRVSRVGGTEKVVESCER